MAYKVKATTQEKIEQRKRGRPKKEINEDALYKLAQSLLPMESIASILDCSKEHLYDNYSHVIQRGREDRKYSLVQAMWKCALEGKDTKMMIWMSKQHLGYRESPLEEATQVTFNVHINEVPK